MAADVQVINAKPLGGGCISEVFCLHTVSHGNLVVKRNSADMVSNFQCESAGLVAIDDAGSIRVPKVVAVGQFGDQAMLVMEHVRTSPSSSVAEFERFGRELARLHQTTRGNAFGWDTDNFLGAARQVNGQARSWADFVAEHRIGFQLRWAVDQGVLDGRLKSHCESVIDRMQKLLTGREEATSLLHGDLWSGNYLFDEMGAPVMIDPAVYRGCREAEWGMILWFGNCPVEFERAYESEWPMADGWRDRVKVYLLYHQLNHLNLFGGGYRSACEQTAAEILRG